MEVMKLTSQSKIVAVNSASEILFDNHYFGLREDKPEVDISISLESSKDEPEMDISIPSEASKEKGSSYIKLHSENVQPKNYKAKQVGWWLGRVEMQDFVPLCMT